MALSLTTTYYSTSLLIQGSNATGDCCSKCWNDLKNKEGGAGVASSPVCQPVAANSSPTQKLEDVVEQPTSTTKPMDIAEEKPTADNTAAVVEKKSVAMEVEEETKPAEVAKPKKKKKKKGYKNLIAGMMEGNGDRVKSEEKDNIKNVTGGGTFMKIDKI